MKIEIEKDLDKSVHSNIVRHWLHEVGLNERVARKKSYLDKDQPTKKYDLCKNDDRKAVWRL